MLKVDPDELQSLHVTPEVVRNVLSKLYLYGELLTSSQLQFGIKSGPSTYGSPKGCCLTLPSGGYWKLFREVTIPVHTQTLRHVATS